MEIFVSRDDTEFGPYSLDDVNAYLASGQLNATDLAWFDGESDWKPLHELLGLPTSLSNPQVSLRPHMTRRAMKITNEQILKIIRLAGEPVGDWFLAGQSSWGTSFIIIGIPLWFNIIRNYLVFTDTHLIVATQTLWSGITAKQVVAISYGDLKRIEMQTARSRWSNDEMGLQYQAGNTLEIELEDKVFSKAIIESVGDYVKLTTAKKSVTGLIVVIVLISIFVLTVLGLAFFG